MRVPLTLVLAIGLAGLGADARSEGRVPQLQGTTSLVLHTEWHYRSAVVLSVTPDTQESIVRLTAAETPTTIVLTMATFAYKTSTGTFDSYREEDVLLFRKTDGTWRSGRNVGLTFNSVLLSFAFETPVGVGEQVTVKVKTPADAGLVTVFLEIFSDRAVSVEELF